MKRFNKNHVLRTSLLLLISCTTIFSFSRFTNFSSTITINDILVDGSIVYAATTGGLFIFDKSTGEGEFVKDIRKFPDLELSSLCKDRKNSLWIGSNRGYLTKIAEDGDFEVYSSYITAGWKINDLYCHDSYLIVGSNRGCSIFNPEKKPRPEAFKNAEKIGNFESPVVNVVAVFNDILYLGCESGFAALDSGETIEKSNFYDQSIWKTRKTDKPVIDWLVHNNSLQAMNTIATSFQDNLTHASGKKVYINNVEALELPSDIISLASNGDQYCWIGTRENYFYRWDGKEQLDQYEIRGLTFKYINHLHVDRKGKLWLMPAFNKPINWHERIIRYNGETWELMDHKARLGSP
ncbi:MAG: hypothetical protein GF401_14700, partial [Chitinivibrionales bacterium]|nr:hypothetical protein [Chitinivibrionales bacterium]